MVSPALLALITLLSIPSSVAAQGSRAAAAIAKGKFLVAGEALRDPNFAETVVLLLNHDDSGTLGLVLNRPSVAQVESFLPDLEGVEDFESSVFVGGPVELHRMTMLFASGEEHTGHLPVLGDVYAGWDEEVLERMMSEPRETDNLRFFAGHAGWAPGQLAAEISARAWYVLPASRADIFTDATDKLWGELIQRTKTRVASISPARVSGER